MNEEWMWAMDTRVARLEERNARLEELVQRLMPINERGRLPPKQEITRIEAQIFYDEERLIKKHNRRSLWSPRFKVEQNHRTWRLDRNVQLFVGDRFYRLVMEKAHHMDPDVKEAITALADQLEGDHEAWAGFVKTKPERGGGRNIYDQIVLLQGVEYRRKHIDPLPPLTLNLSLGLNEIIEFTGLRWGAGDDPKSALYWCYWHLNT